MTTTRITTSRRLAAAALTAVLGLGAAACTAPGPTIDADVDDGDEGLSGGDDADDISNLDTDDVTGNESNLEDPGAGQVGTGDIGDPADDGDELG